MLLVIDNYDSFTYNLVQYFGELGQKVHVELNDQVLISDIQNMEPSAIVISPGPCTPNEAGISIDVIHAFSGKIPILGVCLGHQCIAQALGGGIVSAADVMHGKTSLIKHDGHGLFANLQNPFEATRYHSLVIDEASLPSCLEVSARAGGEIMGVRHRTLKSSLTPIEGVQFHPESIKTRVGMDLLGNFLKMTEG